MPALFRLRRIWWPTLWGALCLCAAAGLVAAVAVRAAGPWLALDEPARGADGRGARTLIVEGWLAPDSLDRAVAIARSGHYERIVTTAGAIDEWQEGVVWATFAERAASYLRRHGIATVIAVPAADVDRDRTYRSAVAVREWARREGVVLDTVDVVSSGVHARRSRLAFRLAFGPGTEVGVRAALPPGYAPEHWWKTSAGAKAVVGELVSLAWTECCFWPDAPEAGPMPAAPRSPG